MSARRLGLLIGAVALLCLAACGDRTGKGGAAATQGETAGQTVNDPFVVGIRQVGEIFVPQFTLPSEISAVSYNLYDWLFDIDHQGKVRPGLAESWELSPDARVLTLRLRRNVVFHTGTPLTADDVVFSWEQMVKGGFSSRVSRALQSIEAVDPQTVRIVFGAPDVGFIPQGGFAVLSRAYYQKAGEQLFREHPVGTGPYAFGELARGRYVDLVRHEAYWGRKPEIRKARFAFVVEDTTRVAQLRAGEADFIMQVPFPLVPEVEQDPALATRVLSPAGMTIFLALKTDDPKTPWADRRVREAIALAIDRDAIVGSILRGYPKHYPLLAPGDVGYDPELKPYAYDPARARQLLKDAGATQLSFPLRYISSATTGMKETAEAVALYLQAVGIDARATPIEGPQFTQWVLKASGDPREDYVAVFIGAIAARAESSSGLLTHFGRVTPFAWYVHPRINELALRAAGTPDEQARAAAIRELGRAVHEDMRYIPLWTNAHVYGMKRCVGFTPTLGDYDLVLLRDVTISGCQPR